MDINFHYAAVKVIAGHAGFSPRDSEVIAYASQFVDDANEYVKMKLDKDPGVPGIRFEDDEFDPICTAHKDLDYVKAVFDREARLLVYACFHFIPSFRGPERKNGRQVRKDGAFARGLVIKALDELKKGRSREKTRSLIRLGIALHSYADTWAHQGFSGFWDHDNNDITALRIKANGQWKAANVVSTYVSYAAPDIGHGEAGSLPDKTDVSWDCKPPKSMKNRSNTVQFLAAAKRILEILSHYNDSPRSWSTLEKKLRKCFGKPAVDAKALRRNSVWQATFPGTGFSYKEEIWFEQALEPKGGFFDWVGSGLGLDPKDYEVKKGRHYFHFHACAQEQRIAVKTAIKAQKMDRGV